MSKEIKEENGDEKTSSNGKHDTDSELSSDSSGNFRKNLKSPHTMLKDGPNTSDMKVPITLSQYEYQTDQYKKLLQEAEQSVSSRDVLITMLQEQLKKLENLYKQSMDQVQDFRFRYCITTQELSGIKKINERYKEEIEDLLKANNKNTSSTTTSDLKNEDDDRKANKVNNSSQEIQVDLGQDYNLKNDIDTLKSQYANIENSLTVQNQRLELLASKLQEELNKSRKDTKNVQDKLIETQSNELNNDKSAGVEENEDQENKNKVYVQCSNQNSTEIQAITADISDYNEEPVEQQSERELYTTNMAIPVNSNSSSRDAENISKQKITFVTSYSQCEKDLAELREENVKLQEFIESLKTGEDKCDEIEKYTLEIVALKKQLKEKDEEIENIKSDIENSIERKNAIIQELNKKNELLKRDYDETLNNYDDLKNKLGEKSSENDKLVKCLCNSNEKLKTDNDEFLEKYENLLVQHNKLKHELDDKINELKVKSGEIDEVKMLLAKTKEENESSSRDCLETCKSKLDALKEELLIKDEVMKELEMKNQNLLTELNDIQNTLNQYKEQAEFKEMENEKLINKENNLRGSISEYQRKCEESQKELEQETERNRKAVEEITEEYENFKANSQKQLQNLEEQNKSLQETLQAKEDKIKSLMDEINSLRKELGDIKSLHEKEISGNDRSLEEITTLFRNKEDELLEVTKELDEQKEHLKDLEDENKKLQKMLEDLQKIMEEQQHQAGSKKECSEACKLLNDKYMEEKTQNLKLNDILQKYQKEISHLKSQLRDLIQSLEHKLACLKKDIQSPPCTPCCASGKSINDMLESIGKFSNVLSTQIAATQFPKCVRENNIQTDIKSEQEIQIHETSTTKACTSNDCSKLDANKSSSFIKEIVDCVPKNCPKLGSETMAAQPPIEETPKCAPDNCPILDAEKLLILRNYSVKRLEGIDKELVEMNCVERSLPESNLNGVKPSNANSVPSSHVNEKDTDDLLFKHKFLSDKITDIDKELRITEDQEKSESKCCSKNLKAMQQMASDLKEMKKNLAKRKNENVNTSEGECQISGGNNLKQKIDNLQQQLKCICILHKEIDELKVQIKLEHSQLHRPLRRCSNRQCDQVRAKPSSNLTNNVRKDQQKRQLNNATEGNKCVTCMYSCKKSQAQENVSVRGTTNECPCSSLNEKKNINGENATESLNFNRSKTSSHIPVPIKNSPNRIRRSSANSAL